MEIDLNPPRGVTQVEELAFPHVTMRGDTARDTKRFTFFELRAHLRDRAADIKRCAEWIDAFRAERLEFFSSERDQVVFVLHIGQRM